MERLLALLTLSGEGYSISGVSTTMTHSHPQGGERGGGGLHKLEPKGTPPIARTLSSTIYVSLFLGRCFMGPPSQQWHPPFCSSYLFLLSTVYACRSTRDCSRFTSGVLGDVRQEGGVSSMYSIGAGPRPFDTHCTAPWMVEG